ncbi:M48 family metallopeptidase [Yoonia sp. 208BN28-4]|uniref:M48 family metallopeptidase n=1 Tax=Yoonia sp. 208BN28-4 TaxID=3126505 RepID=UPI0030A3D573
MRFKTLSLSFALIGLIGCAAPTGDRPTISKEPQTRATQVNANPQADRITARTAVRNFVEVVETVEPVAETVCRNRAPRGTNCDFRIVVDDRPGAPPNAFQTIDETGRPLIAFTIPLIAQSRNRDELAFILAHEAAHHIRGHLARQRQNATVGAVVFGQLAGVIGSGNPEAVQAAQEFGATLGARTYSKDFELEADRLGTIIAAQAGYDPVLGAEFFFRIPDPGNRFLGTHPANADRVRVVQETAAGLRGGT